jgi:hypothetical protein
MSADSLNRFLLEVTITAQSVQSKGRQAGAAEKKWELLPVRRDKRMLRLHSVMDRIRIHALHYTTAATTTIIRIPLFGSSRALAVASV